MTNQPSDNQQPRTNPAAAPKGTEGAAATNAAESGTAAAGTAGAAAGNPGPAAKPSLAEVATGAPAGNEEVLIRKRKRRNIKRKKRLKVALGVLVALVVVGGGAALAITASVNAGKDALHQTGSAQNIQTEEAAVAYDEGKTVVYNGHTYALNESMVSIAVMGYDQRESDQSAGRTGQADAVMVLAFDTQTGKVTAIGIPRDSMVEVGEFVGDAFLGLDTMQLCLAFSYGDSPDRGAQYTTTVASRVLYNMPISHYLALDMNGVAALNDAIGGVALTPLQSIPGTYIVEGEPTVLFGSNALRYVQWRDTSVLTSSLDRQARQVQYLQTYASQVLGTAQGSIGTLVDLFNIASSYSSTNLGVNEFSYLATNVISNGITSLDVVTLPGEMTQGTVYAEFMLDKTGVYETVLDVYYEQVD